MGLLTKLKDALSGNKVDYAQLIIDGAIIVDVRTPGEFQSGHAPNSKNIPLQTISSKVKSLKGKTVILVCRSGARSAQAKSILTSNGITAYNAGRWQNLS